jgi:hypothetical protein
VCFCSVRVKVQMINADLKLLLYSEISLKLNKKHSPQFCHFFCVILLGVLPRIFHGALWIFCPLLVYDSAADLVSELYYLVFLLIKCS